MKHKIDYCDHCKHHIVLCGECGMNTCSGSYGPWAMYLKDGENIPECKSCPEAYELSHNFNHVLIHTNLPELIINRGLL